MAYRDLQQHVSKISSASSLNQVLTLETVGLLSFCHEEAADAVDR